MKVKMTKQWFVAIFGVILALVLIGSSAGTAYAFSGVEGQVVDVNGDPWVHGGDVTVIEMGKETPVATGSLEADGSFSVSYSSNATDNSMMYILIDYNDGGNGDPNTLVRTYEEAPASGMYDAGTISTGTGPLAITLQGVAVTGPETLMPVILTAIALFFLAGISFFVVRRRFVRVE